MWDRHLVWNQSCDTSCPSFVPTPAAWPATGNGLHEQRLQQLQFWRHHELLLSQHDHQRPAPPGERSPDGTQRPRGRQNERSDNTANKFNRVWEKKKQECERLSCVWLAHAAPPRWGHIVLACGVFSTPVWTRWHNPDDIIHYLLIMMSPRRQRWDSALLIQRAMKCTCYVIL